MLPKHEGDTFADCLALEDRLFKEVLSDWKTNKTDSFITFRGKVVRDWRHPLWVPNCTYVRKFVNGELRTNYDLHYVNPVLSSGGVADVGFYVTKYMMKPSDRAVRLQQALHMNLPSDEYEHIWSLVRPRHFESEAFGLGCSDFDVDLYSNGVGFNKKRIYRPHPAVLSHLRKGIEGSKLMPGEPIPSIHSPDDGKFVPLAKYYKGRPEVFTMGDFLDFFYASRKVGADNVIYHEPDHPSQVDIRIDDYRRNLRNVSFQQTAYELDDLFDSDVDDFIEILDIPEAQRETNLLFLEACEQARDRGGYPPPSCPPASAGNE